MAQSRFSLSISEHQKSICAGLTSLQQRGEFVDMTLAADGHLVKVHKFLMALASPYLKELINSAECPHPVIFLSKISYTSLCGILEYIYTGEAVVSSENIKELTEAARSLYIVGWENMMNQSINTQNPDNNQSHEDHENIFDLMKDSQVNNDLSNQSMNPDETMLDDFDNDDASERITESTETLKSRNLPTQEIKGSQPSIQYTVSNRGALQMICNRFVYYPRYTYKKNNAKQWKCVEHIDKNCPAYIVTKDNMVLSRVRAHNHPFHDKKILRKSQHGAIFTEIREVEKIIKTKAATDSGKT